MSAPHAVPDDVSAAFMSLYDRGLPEIYGYLSSRCGNTALAEDLTSETFLAAVRAVQRRPSIELSVGWLVTVARNKLVDHWRRQAAEERRLRLLEGGGGDAEDPQADWREELAPGHCWYLLVARSAPSTTRGVTMSTDRPLDPFETLRRPIDPVAPRAAFAAALRATIAAALGGHPAPDAPPVIGVLDQPSLIVKGGQAAVAFYQAVFGAVIGMDPFIEPDGRIGHIELDFGGGTLSLGDEYPEYDIFSPATLGGTSVCFGIRVPTPADVDALVDRAVAHGATIVFPVDDQFYGERSGRIRDPWGHEWRVQARIEDLTVDEMQKRFAALGDSPAPDPDV